MGSNPFADKSLSTKEVFISLLRPCRHEAFERLFRKQELHQRSNIYFSIIFYFFASLDLKPLRWHFLVLCLFWLTYRFRTTVLYELPGLTTELAFQCHACLPRGGSRCAIGLMANHYKIIKRTIMFSGLVAQ